MSDRVNKPVLYLAAALLILGGGAAVYTQARGLRNNNPGNIRKSGTVWQGQKSQQTDSDYIQFVSPEYGIRALVKVLNTYRTSYGLDTVREIVGRWAPPNENDTASYVNSVAGKVGVSPDATLDFGIHLPALVKAIIAHENGLQPYSELTISRGIALASVA
jgi:hypothetical protein